MKAEFSMSTKLSLDEKNAMCTASIRYGGMGGVFDYTRKNNGKGIVTYYCTHNRKCGCKAKLELRRDKRTGIVDETTKYIEGQMGRG